MPSTSIRFQPIFGPASTELARRSKDTRQVSVDDSSEDETFAIHVSKGGEVVESHTGVTAGTWESESDVVAPGGVRYPIIATRGKITVGD